MAGLVGEARGTSARGQREVSAVALGRGARSIWH